MGGVCPQRAGLTGGARSRPQRAAFCPATLSWARAVVGRPRLGLFAALELPCLCAQPTAAMLCSGPNCTCLPACLLLLEMCGDVLS